MISQGKYKQVSQFGALRQVASRSWNFPRKWYWEIQHISEPHQDGYCFTKKGAYKKAGMEQ